LLHIADSVSTARRGAGRSLLGSVHRQRECHARPMRRDILDLHRAAVFLDNFLDDHQTEAVPLGLVVT
jgi:hypothetical protein